jgi:NDP-sugar pyrophosphorylase family protein
VIEPRIFDFMPAEEIFCINADVYPKVLAAGERVHGCFLARAFHDIGTPARYLETAEALLDGRLAPAYAAEEAAPGFETRPGGVRVARSARIDPAARLEGPLCVGPGAAIGADARVGPWAILGARSRAGEGSRARHAILWEDAALPPGETIERAVLTPSRRVPAAP